MRRSIRWCTVAGAAVAFVGVAFAVDGAQVWHRQITGPAGTYRGAWSAVAAKKVLILGGSNRPASDRSAFSVWALHPKSGDVVWESHIVRTVTKVSEVWEVAAKGRYVAAAGRTDSPEGGRAFAVVAYDARDGSVLWQDHFDREGDLLDSARDIAIGGRVAVAVGSTTTTAEGTALTVRAYDLKSGDLLWEDLHEGEPGLGDAATAVAIRGKRVFVTGSLGTTTGRVATVRAYDLRDGRLLWSDVFDDETSARDDLSHVAISGLHVLVAGTLSTQPGTSMVVRAYAAKSGEVLWSSGLQRAENSYESPSSLAVDRRTVVVGGRSSILGAGAVFVRTFDLRNGGLLWQYLRERAEDAKGWDYEDAEVLAIGKKAVHAGCTVGTAEVGSALAVITLDRRDGREMGASVIEATDEERCFGGTTSGSRLYLTGETEHGNGDWSVPVLSFKAR